MDLKDVLLIAVSGMLIISGVISAVLARRIRLLLESKPLQRDDSDIESLTRKWTKKVMQIRADVFGETEEFTITGRRGDGFMGQSKTGVALIRQGNCEPDEWERLVAGFHG